MQCQPPAENSKRCRSTLTLAKMSWSRSRPKPGQLNFSPCHSASVTPSMRRWVQFCASIPPMARVMSCNQGRASPFCMLKGKFWWQKPCPQFFMRTRRLGCMLTNKGSKSSNIDIGYHLQAATKTFYANKTVLCDKHVSICKQLRYFHTAVTPVACFGAGPRAIHGVEITCSFSEICKKHSWPTSANKLR